MHFETLETIVLEIICLPTLNGTWSLATCRIPPYRAVVLFNGHHRIVEGMFSRHRTGIARRDRPEYYGPWQYVWNRQRRFNGDGA